MVRQSSRGADATASGDKAAALRHTGWKASDRSSETCSAGATSISGVTPISLRCAASETQTGGGYTLRNTLCATRAGALAPMISLGPGCCRRRAVVDGLCEALLGTMSLISVSARHLVDRWRGAGLAGRRAGRRGRGADGRERGALSGQMSSARQGAWSIVAVECCWRPVSKGGRSACAGRSAVGAELTASGRPLERPRG